MVVYGSWGGLCLPPLEIHLTVTGFLYSNFMSVGHLVSQSIISPLASFVPNAQPNQAVFLVLGLPSQDHSCSGSL